MVPLFLRFLAEDCLARRCDVRDLRCSNFPDFVTLNRLVAVLLVFNFGILIRSQCSVYKLTFLYWRLLDFGHVGENFNHLVDFLKPNFWVGDLSSPKLNGQFNLVTILQKFSSTVNTNLQIIGSDAWPESQLFGPRGFGFLFRSALLPLLSEAILFEVQNTHHWGFGVGRDLNQIQPQGLGLLNGFCQRQNANLLAVLINNTNLGASDLEIESGSALFYLLLTSIRDYTLLGEDTQP